MKLISVLWTVACILAAFCSGIWFASGHVLAGLIWALVAVLDMVMVAITITDDRP